VTRPRPELHCMFWRASCARRVSPCGTTGTGLAAHGESLSSSVLCAARVQVGLRARHRVGCVAQSMASFKPLTVFYSDWRFLHVLLTFHCAIACLFCITIGFCNCALFDFRLRMSLPMEINDSSVFFWLYIRLFVVDLLVAVVLYSVLLPSSLFSDYHYYYH